MRNEVMFTGVANIVSAFDRHDNPVFSVWKGRDLLFSNNNDDIAKARALLEENLFAWAEQGNNDALKIVFHPEVDPRFITNKTPISGTLYVRCSEVTGVGNMLPAGAVYPPAGQNLLLEKLTAIESRLTAIEADEDSEDTEDQMDGVAGMVSGINSLLENPVVIGLIGKLLPGLFEQKAAVAGIPSNENYNNAIAFLCSVDPDFKSDIILLANLAKKDKQQFLTLITILRKSK